MTFAEQITLLLLNEESGYFEPIPEWRMQCVMAGAVLMDLALLDRIDTDASKLVLVDASPTGDDLLDKTLAEIVAAKDDPQVTQYWIEKVALNAHDIFLDSLDRLTESGVLAHDDGGFWTLSHRTKAASRKSAATKSSSESSDDVKLRIFTVIYGDDIPDPHDIAVIALVEACEVFGLMLGPEEYEEVKERIELICRLDLIGRSVAEAVKASFKAPRTGPAIAKRQIPTMKISSALFSKALWAGNIPKFIAEQSEKLGSVFRMSVAGKETFVLASADINRWINRRGRLYLRSKEYLESFLQMWGLSRTVASMDGADHYRMRKSMRDGVARSVVEDRLLELYSLARDYMSRLEVGRKYEVEFVCQRMISEQISNFTVSVDMEDYYDDVYDYEARALMVYVYSVLPKFLIRTPKMKRKRERIMELYAKIHGSHSPAQRVGKRRDLVDDLLDLHAADPQFLPETDIGFAFIAALIAGHYSGSELSFAMYCFLTEHDVRERIIAEADEIFGHGDPTHEDLKRADFDVTRRFIMEVIRLYNIIPGQNRQTMNGFTLDGVDIPPRTNVLVAHTAPHYHEENFKDATKFDVERYLPPRDEHKKPGAYQPFGVGTHTCLGQRWTEFQLIMNVLLIAHHLELEMVPENYKLKISPMPKLKPNKKFKFRIKAIRHPLTERSKASVEKVASDEMASQAAD